MQRIMVIAPQQEIVDIVRGLGEGLNGVGVVQARLEHGVEAARQAIAAGATVLVSRGLTYRMIVEALPDVPVVEIEFSGYDVLRAYRYATKRERRVAVVGMHGVVEGFEAMEEIMEHEGEIIKVELATESAREYSEGVGRALRQGAACVIGNQAVAHEAERRGVTGVVVRSGREALRSAINAARAVLDRLLLREANARQIDTIINVVDYGILAVDGGGCITAINSEARRLLYQEGAGAETEKLLVNKMLRSIGDREKKIGIIERFGEKTEVVVNFLPIGINGVVGGMVATLQELGQLQAVEQKARRELARRGWVAKYTFDDIKSTEPKMLRLIEDAKRLASFDASLLIQGETGVGKEYFAHAVHNASKRKKGPFVAVNCASIPENILESELFGYAEGAFTGAKRGGKIGLFEQAHGGTIFLDEIGEMAERCQVRLLRVLQEREVYRVGDDRVIPVDIRVVAATHRDLWAMVQENQFREDLYYRLEVLTLEVPPLRERKIDLEMFVRQFVDLYNRQYHTAVKGIVPTGLELLMQYDWPGNIRELQNMVGRLVALAQGEEVTVDDVKRCLKTRLQQQGAEIEFKDAELTVIRRALEKTGGNKQEAADLLGICRSTLWRKLKSIEK